MGRIIRNPFAMALVGILLGLFGGLGGGDEMVPVRPAIALKGGELMARFGPDGQLHAVDVNDNPHVAAVLHVPQHEPVPVLGIEDLVIGEQPRGIQRELPQVLIRLARNDVALVAGPGRRPPAEHRLQGAFLLTVDP